MGIRPAKTIRKINKVAWARYSKKKPRKSFVKAMPHLHLTVYNMGKMRDDYEMQFDLTAKGPIQLRDNALESARQAANKYLEKLLLNEYHFVVRVFPHNVLRENKMISGAGADRLQKGMRASFGRPTSRAARVPKGQPIFSIKTMKENTEYVDEAYRRARSKLSGKYKTEVRELT